MELHVIKKALSVQRDRRHPLRAAIAALLLATVLETQAQTTATNEYKVKASCLFNFAQFVEWPAAAFADAASPIVIGVLGEDAFGPFLDQIVQGEKVRSRPLIVRRARTVDALKACHILFVSKSEDSRLTGILASLEPNSVLTVGEAEGFARRGGVINFYLDGERLRFEINPGAAVHCGLKISSQLLSLGKLVETADGKETK